jgi:ribonuclease P protein component
MRLRRSEDFQTVWSIGKSWKHPLFIIWAMPNELPYSRVGIVASRKVGKSVIRNRTRRLLKEAARHIYTNINPGWDIVLVARSRLSKVNQLEVEDALHDMLLRAKLYRNSRIP